MNQEQALYNMALAVMVKEAAPLLTEQYAPWRVGGGQSSPVRAVMGQTPGEILRAAGIVPAAPASPEVINVPRKPWAQALKQPFENVAGYITQGGQAAGRLMSQARGVLPSGKALGEVGSWLGAQAKAAPGALLRGGLAVGKGLATGAVAGGVGAGLGGLAGRFWDADQTELGEQAQKTWQRLQSPGYLSKAKTMIMGSDPREQRALSRMTALQASPGGPGSLLGDIGRGAIEGASPVSLELLTSRPDRSAPSPRERVLSGLGPASGLAGSWILGTESVRAPSYTPRTYLTQTEPIRPQDIRRTGFFTPRE